MAPLLPHLPDHRRDRSQRRACWRRHGPGARSCARTHTQQARALTGFAAVLPPFDRSSLALSRCFSPCASASAFGTPAATCVKAATSRASTTVGVSRFPQGQSSPPCRQWECPAPRRPPRRAGQQLPRTAPPAPSHPTCSATPPRTSTAAAITQPSTRGFPLQSPCLTSTPMVRCFPTSAPRPWPHLTQRPRARCHLSAGRRSLQVAGRPATCQQ